MSKKDHKHRAPSPPKDKSLEVSEALQRAVKFLQVGEPGSALEVLNGILERAPDECDALQLSGIAQAQLGRLDIAVERFKSALRIKRDHPETHNNLGNALSSLKRYEEAIQSYESAINLKPNIPEPYKGRGSALHNLNRFEEAIESYERALELKPNLAGLHNNIGAALTALKRYEEAIVSYKRALKLKPDFPEAHNNLGNALNDLKRHKEAIVSYKRALELKSDYGNALSMLVNQKRYICDWFDFEELSAQLTQQRLSKKIEIQPFLFLEFSDHPSEIFEVSMKYCEEETKFVKKLPPIQGRPLGGPIKLAYVSADLRNHAVGYQMAELFELHDKSAFEVHVLNVGTRKNDATKYRISNGVDHFHEVQTKSDLEVAQLIRELSIDISVDLMGFTKQNRLGVFASKPAPIQVGYLGYPGTIGGDFLDYILADDFVAPLDHQQFFSEKLALLPHSYQVNDSKRPIIIEPPPRIGVGLPEDAFVFCCFNTPRKITPSVFDVWMRLLKQCPKSVLWLVSDNNSATENLKQEARRRAVDLERLLFAPRVPLEEHITRQAAADLFVDTFPYPAHGTGSHALWAGLPLLTCVGNSFHSRVSGSLLRAVGLPELITTSLEDYEALALKLAGDPDLLASYRKRLADNRTTAPLFDCKRFTRNLETAYQQMWQRWQEGKPPEAFAVVEPN